LPKTVFVQSITLGILNNARSHPQYNATFVHFHGVHFLANKLCINLNPSTTHQTMAPILPTLARASFFSGFSHLYTRSENIFHIWSNAQNQALEQYLLFLVI
jgi:hypothetical protein